MSATTDPTRLQDASNQPDLREITGPSALGDTEPRRIWDLLRLISATEFKVQYANTSLGYFWALLRPLIFFGVIFLILREVLRFGDGIENYSLMLIMNIVLFQYFQESTTRAVRSVAAREGMVRKLQFPRVVIPLSVCLTASFTLALNLVVVFVLFLISGLTPAWSWLLFPVVVVGMLFLVVGLSLILSALYVRSEDTQQTWNLIGRMLFYGSPILFPIEFVPDSFRDFVAVNPLAPLFIQTRAWVIDPNAPGVIEASGVWIGLVIPMTLLIGIFVFGLWLFNREAPRVAEAL